MSASAESEWASVFNDSMFSVEVIVRVRGDDGARSNLGIWARSSFQTISRALLVSFLKELLFINRRQVVILCWIELVAPSLLFSEFEDSNTGSRAFCRPSLSCFEFRILLRDSAPLELAITLQHAWQRSSSV